MANAYSQQHFDAVLVLYAAVWPHAFAAVGAVLKVHLTIIMVWMAVYGLELFRKRKNHARQSISGRPKAEQWP